MGTYTYKEYEYNCLHCHHSFGKYSERRKYGPRDLVCLDCRCRIITNWILWSEETARNKVIQILKFFPVKLFISVIIGFGITGLLEGREAEGPIIFILPGVFFVLMYLYKFSEWMKKEV